MVSVQLAMDEERQCTGTTKSIPVSLHPKLCELWQGLVSDGLITQVRGLLRGRCQQTSIISSSAEVAITISYPESASVINLLLKAPKELQYLSSTAVI